MSDPTFLDAKVSSILGQKLDSSRTDPGDLDEDALFEELEKEDDSAYRAHRLEQLHKEVVSAKEALKQNTPNNNNNNTTTTIDAFYPTLVDDRAVLDLTTNNERCIVHFSHTDFARCTVMDEHLRLLAPRHHEVRFARIDVRNCPFVVEKLNIRVLPCVIGFVDGNGKERIIGFEGLVSIGKSALRGKGADNFRTTDLEKRLVQAGILVRGKYVEEIGRNNDEGDMSESESENERGGKSSRRKGIRDGTSSRRYGQDNSDDDWD
ncbi:NTP binding protein, putative [Talaromyces stipitatus ATCC 10500]|uniref:NTP binding protein, putative n=1 Tax=Talaromyces stipitatus (strain ATCC 10500 / CBS 375.48 / QM 6759 / NRRL 1006) TaxID=441959 RepID=B8MC04_TALSN|nr:NTP binding protein, putative [Talaromyces stipitatus ATCC 10500]EED18450.1 NTP binding protein, putative [Talaromyces stipitatus ATCC 10500]